MTPKRILLSWSGGKDCAWALHLLRQDPSFEVVALLTTLNRHFNRVAMHGYRESLLDLQGEATGLPIWKVPLPWPCTNEQYQAAMSEACARAVAEGLHGIALATSSSPTSAPTASSNSPPRASRPSSPAGACPPPRSRSR